MGREVMEGLRFLASLPLAGTGQREGGGFSCTNKRIISHPVIYIEGHQVEDLGWVDIDLDCYTTLPCCYANTA